jgi:inosose dehydratase
MNEWRFNMKQSNVKIGIAPIAWTNDDMPDLGCENTFEQCVSEMALAGYAGTEIGNKYPKNTETLGKALELRHLEVASAWFSSFLTTQPFEQTQQAFLVHRDFLHAMGAKVIVVSEQGHSIQGKIDAPIFENKYVLNDAEWEKLSSGLNRLGKLAAEKDMKLVYHHHMGTVVQTIQEIDRLMATTDPQLVYLLFDSGHLVFSGEDAQVVLEKYIQRVKHVHLKDVRSDILKTVKEKKMSFLQAVRAGAFTVPGDGCIDFIPLFKILEQNDYEGWMLVEAEQDPAVANPLEYALKARNYIHEQTGC